MLVTVVTHRLVTTAHLVVDRVLTVNVNTMVHWVVLLLRVLFRSMVDLVTVTRTHNLVWDLVDHPSGVVPLPLHTINNSGHKTIVTTLRGVLVVLRGVTPSVVQMVAKVTSSFTTSTDSNEKSTNFLSRISYRYC